MATRSETSSGSCFGPVNASRRLCITGLIRDVEFGGLIAGKASDANVIIAELGERGAKVVVPQHPRRPVPASIDTEVYKWRHLIENICVKLKGFKRTAMRSDKAA